MLADVLERVYSPLAPRFAYGLDASGETVFAALRTPPWFQLASQIDAHDAGPFVERWLEDDPELPGVGAPSATARAIAAAWSARTGRPTRCRMKEALHALDEVRDPLRPALGELRGTPRR